MIHINVLWMNVRSMYICFSYRQRTSLKERVFKGMVESVENSVVALQSEDEYLNFKCWVSLRGCVTLEPSTEYY